MLASKREPRPSLNRGTLLLLYEYYTNINNRLYVVSSTTVVQLLPGAEVLRAETALVDRHAVERGYTLKLSTELIKKDIPTTTTTLQ